MYKTTQTQSETNAKLEVMIDLESLVRPVGSEPQKGFSVAEYEIAPHKMIADLVTLIYQREGLGIQTPLCQQQTHNSKTKRRPSLVMANSVKEYGIFEVFRGKWQSNGTEIRELLAGDNNPLIVFGRKLRITSVRYLDSSMKTLLIDHSSSVRGVVRDICSIVGMENPEEVGLIVAADYSTTSGHHPAIIPQIESDTSKKGTFTNLSAAKKLASVTNASLSPAQKRRYISKTIGKAAADSRRAKRKEGRKKKKQISKKRQLRLDTPWLDLNLSLPEQDVLENDQLILMHRYFYNMQLESGSKRAELLFSQCKAKFLAGELFCSQEDCHRFAALLCQISFGDHHQDSHTESWLISVKKSVLPPKFKAKTLCKSILLLYQALRGIAFEQCQLIMLKLWSSMPLFGYEFFSGTNLDSKKKCLLGVSKQFVLYSEQGETSFSRTLRLDSLTSWDFEKTSDSLSLVFPSECFNIYLPDYSGIVADTICSHLEHIRSCEDELFLRSEFILPSDLCNTYRSIASVFGIKSLGTGLPRTISYQSLYDGNNPLFTPEEIESVQVTAWENPAFHDMDQLLEERFNFLDDIHSIISEENLSQIVPPSFANSPNQSPVQDPKYMDDFQVNIPDLNPRPSSYPAQTDSDPVTPVGTPPYLDSPTTTRTPTSNLVTAFEKKGNWKKPVSKKLPDRKTNANTSQKIMSFENPPKWTGEPKNIAPIPRHASTGVIINAFETLHKNQAAQIAKFLEIREDISELV
ncbi:Talin-2 [Oopsacas minuta]|uniref:Talin-2 n=1 Tax=Oopsacas minuta TaxID=111878 RepID=A0AAV7K1Z1_9METZ|nr:Talin-2 [Oopsacas minuta]